MFDFLVAVCNAYRNAGYMQSSGGDPVFHDALKGLSCCNKKSTDFTRFLGIPGYAKQAPLDAETAKPEVFAAN
jgi:hypothetical protein